MRSWLLAFVTVAALGHGIVVIAAEQAAVTHVTVNGRAVAVGGSQTIRLPATQLADLSIDFRPFSREAAGASGTRLLFKLDGEDADWRDVAPSDNRMRMSVFFYEPSGRQAGMVEWFMEGKSTGWRGTLAASQFSRRTARVTVPANAARMGVAFWSGGMHETVGVLAIDRILVRRIGSGSDDGGTVADLSFGLDDPPWERFGSNSESAVYTEVGGVRALGLIDGDKANFSGWRLVPGGRPAVTPGEELEIEWGEIFSIGGDDVGTVRYPDLVPGTYRFRLAAATTEGVPTGVETVTEFILPAPFWSRPPFIVACGLVGAGVVFGLWRIVAGHRMQVRIAQLEKAHAVSMERTRIAKDLHDELGGSLTQIALESELTRERLAEPGAARTHLDSIFTTAQDLARKLDAVVWAVSPAQDTLESLATFLAKESQRLLGSAGIACRIQMPADEPAIGLSAVERRSIYLAIKEALHNVVQHAKAREVWLRMSVIGGELQLDVEDDGVGLSPAVLAGRIPPGHDGLANIRSRVAGIGGTCDVGPGPGGRGTLVRLRVPVVAARRKGQVA